MEATYVDRILTCSDCRGEFVFTAGEQYFFFEKQFKNDPKRCKPCKSRRAGITLTVNGEGPTRAGLCRTETRTQCSACEVETTVPFKPTQGRPVLCRQCFQNRNRIAAAQPGQATASVAGAEVCPSPPSAEAAAPAAMAPRDGGRDAPTQQATLTAIAATTREVETPSCSVADLDAFAEYEDEMPKHGRFPVELLNQGLAANFMARTAVRAKA